MGSVQIHSRPAADARSAALEIFVLHTTMQHTALALRKASELAQGLAAKIRLLVPQVVPYPLLLHHPPVPLAFTVNRFRNLAALSRVETLLDVRLCREVGPMLERMLPPGSIVVVGERSRWWWPTAESRLARRLQRLGHHVIREESV